MSTETALTETRMQPLVRRPHFLHGKCLGGPCHGYVVSNPTMKPVVIRGLSQGECHEYKSVMYGSEREFFILYVHHSIADDDEEILKRNELAAEVIGGFV